MDGDPDDIRNWLRLSDGVTTSGKLQSGDPQRLANIGVRRVINLALAEHPEALPDAERAMAEAGLAYAHIPVPFDAPTEAHYQAFVAALEADDTPVHVHCIMNWRVSTFFCRYRVEHGMDADEARRQMEQIWSPEENGHKDAPKWAAFLRGEDR
jgi:uncharacterized protein (TIGR01244 family)